MDQEILYVVKADNKNAIAQFEALRKTQEGVDRQTRKLANSTQQGNMMLMSTSRIIQDAPFGFMAVGNNITFLAEQFAYAKTQGMGFGASLKAIGASFMGTGGIIFLISTATSLLTYLSMNAGKASTEVDGLSKAFDSLASKLIKVKSSFKDGFFSFTPEQLQNSINKLKAYISALDEIQKAPYKSVMAGQVPFGAETSQMLSKMFGKTDQWTEDELRKKTKIKEVMQDQLDQLEAQKELMQILGNLGGTWTETQEKSKFDQKEINGLLQEALDIMLKMPVYRVADPMKPFREYFVGGVKDVKDPGAGFSQSQLKQDFMKENELLMDGIRSSANVLRSEFGSAWQDIFGEANSLFEKMLMNWTELFASKLLDKAGFFLLDWFIPGASSLFERSQTINVNMGNENVEKVVIKGLRGAQQKRLI